jgi:hypothetical protein
MLHSSPEGCLDMDKIQADHNFFMELYIALGKAFLSYQNENLSDHICPNWLDMKFLQRGECRSICTYYDLNQSMGICMLDSC